jgi:hypothetical protein
MDRQLSIVLTETLEAARTQLTAARKLDAESLADATECRQDLQFELELLVAEEAQKLDEEISDLVRTLQETDLRLMRILGAANAVFDDVLYVEAPATYGASGRMRER